jgi:hypothetical protein
LVVPPFIQALWAAMLIFAIYTNVVGWFAAQDLEDERWIQWPLILLGFTVGFVADELRCQWIDGVAHALHFEDVIDGVCADHASEANESAVWHWYKKRGKPLGLALAASGPRCGLRTRCIACCFIRRRCILNSAAWTGGARTKITGCDFQAFRQLCESIRR